jgi:hypothetical protein
VLALHRIAGCHQSNTLLRPTTEAFCRERHPTTLRLLAFLLGQFLEGLLVEFQVFDLQGLAHNRLLLALSILGGRHGIVLGERQKTSRAAVVKEGAQRGEFLEFEQVEQGAGG